MVKTSSEESPEPLKYQTWVLKVYIHCEGCKKKVKRVLQSIEGVYMTTVDSQQQKVTVTGNVNAETLIKKLLKTGKQAELWSDKSHKKPENSKDGKKDAEKNDGKAGDGDQKTSAENLENGEDEKEAKESTDKEGSDSEGDADKSSGANGEGEKKKKKKKKKKKGKNPISNNDGESPKIATNPSLASPMIAGDANIPHQHLYQDPQMYYPPPVYGMSYNTMHPTASGSYYAPTMSAIYPPAPPPEPIRYVACDEYAYVGDDENIGCLIM